MRQRYIVLLTTLGLILLGAGVVFYSPLLAGIESLIGEQTVTRELPDRVAPGERIIVKLHFDLGQPTIFTVKETITGSDGDTRHRTLSLENTAGGTVAYDIKAPNTPGQLTFSGTVPELGISIGGDQTVGVGGE